MFRSVTLEFGTQPDSKGIKDVLTHLSRDQYLGRLSERVRVRVDSRVGVLSELWLLRRIVRVEIDVVGFGRSVRSGRPPGTETGGLAHGGLSDLMTKTGRSVLVAPSSHCGLSGDSVVASLAIITESSPGKNSIHREVSAQGEYRPF
jgi:hypothetical protein